MLVRPGKLRFPASDPVEIREWWNPNWQLIHRRRILNGFTHVLIESGSTILGGVRGGHFDRDLPALADAGVTPGLVFHGSDIRAPAIHRELVASSPFHVRDELTERLEATTTEMLRLVGGFEGPIFISTKDLLDYVPEARWLPQVVDVEQWARRPLLLGERRTVVASTFTNRRLKGADVVDAACERLASEGRIEYRRYANVPPELMPGIVGEVDVLIDGISLGLYGTTSVEGMASGRLVLANLERVVDKPGEIPPVVDVNAETFADVLADILERPGHYRDVAERGPGYVSRYHDGRYAAGRIAEFVGIGTAADEQADEPAIRGSR
jgi:hypothetical protein